MSSSAKRIYQGVYLDIREDIESDNAIARAADQAMLGVDSETIELYRKYNLLDKLPERLRYVASSPLSGVKRANSKRAKSPELIREWNKRLAEYR